MKIYFVFIQLKWVVFDKQQLICFQNMYFGFIYMIFIKHYEVSISINQFE